MTKPSYGAFNELAAEYDAWFDGEGRNVFKTELNALQSLLPYLPEPWLEIGAGSGRFAQALGIKTGIEPSLNMGKAAARRGINIVRGTGEQQIFSDASFGTVFLITALCFVKEPLKVMEETYRLLKSGGKMVLGLILKDNPWGQTYEQQKREGHPIYAHATFYRCNEVARLTLQAGFSGERIVSTLFQKPGYVEYPEDPLDGFYRDAGFVVIVAGKPCNQ
ncbi:MAG: class I SAM-dependent methyltransferase [Dehalococcoidales bacterium]|nr:class I SAM-dependent methyltransferase [Dehalococcoidales bacterium]